MRITLNLATRPYADLGPAMHRLRIGMGALAALCLALLLGLHLVHNKAEIARAHEHSLDGQLARITAERQGYVRMMQQPDNAALLRQVNALNEIFDQKAFSWTLAMENLETVLPGGVMVTTLEPVRDKTGAITLHLRVVGPRDLGVDLVRNLEHSRRFLHPRIVGENSEAAGNGTAQRLEPVSASNRFDFDLLAEYNPPTPEEEKAAGREDRKREPTPEADATGARREPRVEAPAQARRPSAARRARPVPVRPEQSAPSPVPGRLRNPFPPQGGEQ